MLEERRIRCDTGTRVILSHAEKIEIRDRVLIADNGTLSIATFTETTNIDNVIGKTKKVYRLF